MHTYIISIIIIIIIIIIISMFTVAPARGDEDSRNEHNDDIISPASRRDRDKRGVHRRATNPMHFVICCCKCARVATFCNIVSYVATVCPHLQQMHRSGRNRFDSFRFVVRIPHWRVTGQIHSKSLEGRANNYTPEIRKVKCH